MITSSIFYFFIVVVGTAGEICVSRASRTIGEVTDFRLGSIARHIGSAMKQSWMWIGVSMMALAFFSLLGMLAIAKASFVFPATALSYAAGAFGGKLFLNEKVSLQRWIGVLVICFGVVLVALGKG